MSLIIFVFVQYFNKLANKCEVGEACQKWL